MRIPITFIKISGLLLLPMLVTGLALWSLLADELEWEWEADIAPIAFLQEGVDESDPDALFLAAKTAVSANDLAQAEQYLYQAIVLRPQAPRLHHELGVVLAAQGRPRDAIVAFQTALALDETRLNTILALGRLYMQQGNTSAAEALFRQASNNRAPTPSKCMTSSRCVS